MSFWKSRLGNSVFVRLVITFLIIMIPIYMLGLYIYQWGLNTVKKEISQSTIAQSSFYLEGLENEIERIKILQYDCLNDENLNKLAVRWEIMDQHDIIESIRQLQQRLVTIQNSSEYIKDVSIDIYPIQRTVSSNAGITDFDMEEYENIRVPYGIKGAQIISYNGGLYLSTLQEGNLLANDPLYLIKIELDRDVLKRALDQFSTYEESGSYLVSHTGSNVIINQSDENSLFTEDIMESIRYIDGNGMVSSRTGNKDYYMVYVESDYLGMVLVRYIPSEYIQTPINHFYAWVWIFSISAVLIIIIYSFHVYKVMRKPMLELVDSFREVESGNLQVWIDHDMKNEFGYLYKHFNEMTRKLRVLIDQVYKQKILMQRAELKQLQSQINPHFLYNSLFMINTMVRVNDDNIIPFTKYLGEYFRYITRNSSDYVPLIDEVNHVKVYANIQLIRFPKRFEIQFDECPEQYINFKVPRLILQPLIENAFEHGIGKKNNNGLIVVRFQTDEKGLTIIVEDNGNELSDSDIMNLRSSLEDESDEIEITGIINIYRRIKLIYGEESGLEISRSRLGGLMVMLRVKGGDGHLQTVNS